MKTSRAPWRCSIPLAIAATALAGCMSDDDDRATSERARSCDLYLRDHGVSVRTAG